MTSVDTENIVESVATTMALGCGGWILGHAVERTVGTRGVLPRMLVNALVLYSCFMLLPWSITSHFQNTLSGLLFCAAFFNTQTWTARKLF